MLELLGDLFTLALIGLAIWYCMPKAARAAIANRALGPAVSIVAEGIRTGARAVERHVYRLITGRPYPVRGEKPLTAGEHVPERTRLVMSESPAKPQTDRQTDRDRPVSVAADDLTALRLDRTRAGVVKALVAAGWSASEIRGVVKGDNGDIGREVQAAREALQVPDAEAPGPPAVPSALTATYRTKARA